MEKTKDNLKIKNFCGKIDVSDRQKQEDLEFEKQAWLLWKHQDP